MNAPHGVQHPPGGSGPHADAVNRRPRVGATDIERTCATVGRLIALTIGR